MVSNLRPNPYKEMNPSDQQPQFTQDVTYSQVLDRRNSYETILAPLFHNHPAPIPDLGRSFAIETAAQVAPQGTQEHANGTTLLNPPLNNGWKFTKTADWAKKGLEQTWEERRPGPPSPIPMDGLTFGPVYSESLRYNNTRMPEQPIQRELNAVQKELLQESKYRQSLEFSLFQDDSNQINEHRQSEQTSKSNTILPNFGTVIALRNQALEQSRLTRENSIKSREGQYIGNGMVNREQNAIPSPAHGQKTAEKHTDSSTRIAASKRSQLNDQNTVGAGNTRKKSKTEPESQFDGGRKTMKQASSTTAPHGKNDKVQRNNENVHKVEFAPKLMSKGSKIALKIRSGAGAYVNNKTPQLQLRANEDIAQRGSVIEAGANLNLSAEIQEKSSKSTANAVADYLRSIEGRGAGSTRIEGWKERKLTSVIIPAVESFEQGARSTNTEFQAGHPIIGGLGGVPFPDILGTEGNGLRRGVGGVAGAVESARLYHELIRQNGMSQ